MKTFDIREHVQFDQKGRAQCPVCLSEGKTGKNLSVQKNGAYKCFRGCPPEEIRVALGSPKTEALPPPTPSSSPPPTTVSADTVQANHQVLMTQSTKAKEWLLERGITGLMMQHYQLGVARAKCGQTWLPAITIPIPADEPGQFFQKKRVAPWLTESDRPEGYKKWSQYGIPSRIFWAVPPTPTTTMIWVCEGEWDAMVLGWSLSLGMTKNIAICTFTCGAGNPPKDLSAFEGMRVVTFYDIDSSGDDGAIKLYRLLPDQVRIAIVPHPDDAKKGYDVSNAIQDGFTLEDFCAAARCAIVPTPTEEPPPPENPLRKRLISNAELIDRAPDHTEWLVPDLLTEDELFVLAAPPRGRKSFFCLTLAKAISTGGKFLDRPVTQGSVLYVNCEDSETKVKEREQTMDWPREASVFWLDRFKLSELPYLIEIADEIPDLRLIVLDTLSRVRDDANKESSAELSRVLEPLQELAKDRKICILATHHTGKLGTEVEAHTDPFDLLRGSSAIRATARGVLMILPGDGCYRLISENGHAEKLDLKIRPHATTGEIQLLGRWEPRIDSDIRSRVLDYLNLNGQGSVSQIATDLQLNARWVGNVCSKLHGDDLITKVGGKGRQPAIYMRSFTLLHRSEATSEAYNVDRERDSALLHLIPGCEKFSEKVSSGEKSEQNSAHFSNLIADTTEPVKQSCNPLPASNTCLTSSDVLVKQSEAKCNPELENATEQFEQSMQTVVAEIAVGDRVNYVGSNWQRQRMFDRKKLEVVSLQDSDGLWVTVRHSSLVIQQTVPATELRRTT